MTVLTDEQKAKKEDWHKRNLRVLTSLMGGRFTVQNEHRLAMFREDGLPMVNFHLAYGTWRIVGTGTTKRTIKIFDQKRQKMKRGAWAFVDWYKEMEKQHANRRTDEDEQG